MHARSDSKITSTPRHSGKTVGYTLQREVKHHLPHNSKKIILQTLKWKSVLKKPFPGRPHEAYLPTAQLNKESKLFQSSFILNDLPALSIQ